MAENVQSEGHSRILGVLEEKDPFRIIIRGQAVIEEVLNEAINAAFSGGTPPELKQLPLRSRLALARALELLTMEILSAIAALAKIRNEFAHGAADELTEQHAKSLRQIVASIYPQEEVDVDEFSAGDLLRIAVGTVCWLTQDTSNHALQEREAAEASLAEFRRSRGLSASDVAVLLASTEGKARPIDSHPVAADS